MDLILLWLLGVLMMFSSVGSVDYDSGSSSGGGVTAEPPPEPSAVASPVLDPVQEKFRARTRLASCGHYEVEHGTYEEAAQPGWLCLQDAAYTQGAEVRFSTIATGAVPVDTYVRVIDGVMEIYVHDPSVDPYAAWTYDTCSVEESSFRQGCP